MEILHSLKHKLTLLSVYEPELPETPVTNLNCLLATLALDSK